ncbi:MAG: ferredoxin--NADP reductase [Acidobacteriota bacterium]
MANPKEPFSRAKILERRDVTPTLLVLKLEREGSFTFRPGQFCTLGIDGIERAYSLVSSPHESFLEIFIEVVEGGALTPRFRELQPGDTLCIRPEAKGTFTLEPERQHQVMVATVTGVAPFISMIRHAFHGDPPGNTLYLLQGASYQDEFTYREEMESLASRHPDLFHYLPTVSRPSEARNRGWTGSSKRVNLIVEELIDKFSLRPDATQFYACGNPGMIEDVKKRLVPGGFPVKEEKYWME